MSDKPQQSSTVTLTLDGNEISVPRGSTLIEAAEQAGVRVPHYCYHPGLSSPAMCRLCLVEVEGAPKLQPSCVTMAQDGQTVHTNSQEARKQRQGVLEFYLVNHPLDCPICDQSGECKLQDYVFAEGRKHGRSQEPKRVFGRDDFGGDVLFYGDRCVMCTRCVRFMDEVAGDPRLTVVERGDRAIIDTFFEEGLSGSPFAGNIVDICPVGALVSKDFLHKARAWDLDHTPSVCTSCSQGCNIQIHTRDNEVQRLKPRENLEVNGFWMCDEGRHNYEWMNSPHRLEVPRVSEVAGESPVAMGWGRALDALLPALREGGPVMAVASPFASNEDLGALAHLVERLGGGDLVFRSPEAETEVVLPGFPQLVRRRDLSPNRTGAELLGFRRVGDAQGQGGLEAAAAHDGILLILGDELRDQEADFGTKARFLVRLGSTASGVEAAHAHLPITTHAEQDGSFANHEGRVQRFWPALKGPGAARPAWMILGTLAARLDPEAMEEGPGSAAEAFHRLVAAHGPFAGMSFDALGTRGVPVSQPAALQGA
ncbi:MAG: 2Fe-2S iron-sulfur cluster-binding protein [Gemmatimonadota bacterium]